ncbi:GGDEF domain-containing protein [Ensifer adhaerens]|uniref:GGDEF domain-containing protein n=1 Tax=Ensifer adhaerens TaxID=106592 RepID=UPI0023AA05E9|nr:GGDEF domain-containing protein [Ensifer adhaerens]WDZ77742.1 GGDEF domain-containing protein [Ensifer adhaerens]
MSAHGIAALPRNYELFYEALSGRLPQLSRELAALGLNPPQDSLDALGLKHHLVSHAALAADRARAAAQETLAGMASKLKLALAQKQTFKTELDRFTGRLADDPVVGLSEFADDAARLRETAGHLLNQENALQHALEASAQRMAEFEEDLAESRRSLTRDLATGLPNRLALTAKLDSLLETEQTDQPIALLLVFVDGLREMAEHHGGTVASKALAKLSALFRKSIKKNDFVARVGQQEFAFVCRDVSVENAEAIARRLCQSVQDVKVTLPGRAHTAETLSLAAGITIAQPASTSADLMTEAELALAGARDGAGILSYSAALGRGKTYGQNAA